jgi:hypothetical protein
MATRVKSLYNKSNVMIPVVMAGDNLTVHLPPGESITDVNVENWHSIEKYCKTVLDLGEVNPAPQGTVPLND